MKPVNSGKMAFVKFLVPRFRFDGENPGQMMINPDRNVRNTMP